MKKLESDFSVCMCGIHVCCACGCVRVCTPMQEYAEARGRRLLAFFLTLASSPQASAIPTSTSQHWADKGKHGHAGFLCGLWDSSSGPHISTVSALTHRAAPDTPAPQLLYHSCHYMMPLKSLNSAGFLLDLTDVMDFPSFFLTATATHCGSWVFSVK